MDFDLYSDEYFMKEALKEARIAFDAGEVPVGAVIVAERRIIARSHNQTEILNDATAHAEMLAITSAANSLGSKYLNQCTLFVSLEPCTMCAAASCWSQLGRIVYGASDPKSGFRTIIQDVVHPKTQVTGGVLNEECSRLIKEFFQSKR